MNIDLAIKFHTNALSLKLNYFIIFIFPMYEIQKKKKSQPFWSRKWQPTSVILPGESHGQRSLADYSPWSRKEWDMTERLSITF